MMGREDYLFCEGDLDDVLRAHQGSIITKVDAIPRDQFMNAQLEEVVDHVVSEMSLETLVIYDDQAEMEQRETKIDVSGWQGRNPFGDSGPIYVSGVSVSVSIPFTVNESKKPVDQSIGHAARETNSAISEAQAAAIAAAIVEEGRSSAFRTGILRAM